MDYNNIIKNENEISYEYLNRIKEHAKNYDYSPNKKEFLRSVSPYEQKLILLTCKKPYDALIFLNELNLKETKEILNELNYEEIHQILERFSLEDKRSFYENFSYLNLVNDFITHDKDATEIIEPLTNERKIDLLNSSDKSTIEASSKIYESIPEDQRDIVAESVTTLNGSAALSEAVSLEETHESQELQENIATENLDSNLINQEQQIEELQEEQDNKDEQQKQENQEEQEKQEEIEEQNKQDKQEKPEKQEELEIKENLIIDDNIDVKEENNGFIEKKEESNNLELFKEIMYETEKLEIEKLLTLVDNPSLEGTKEKTL